MINENTELVLIYTLQQTGCCNEIKFIVIKLSVLFFWFSAVTLINKLWCNTHFSVLQTKIIVPVMREFIRFWLTWYAIDLYYLILVKSYIFHLSFKQIIGQRNTYRVSLWGYDILLVQIGIGATCYSICFKSLTNHDNHYMLTYMTICLWCYIILWKYWGIRIEHGTSFM